SHANKHGMVIKDGSSINVHSYENLQALCFKCNRAKRDTDNTDFRKTERLVRNLQDESPNYIISKLRHSMKEALQERLFSEFEKDMSGGSRHTVESLADTLEVFLLLAELNGHAREKIIATAESRRTRYGPISLLPEKPLLASSKGTTKI